MTTAANKKSQKFDFPVTCTVKNIATQEHISLHGWVEQLTSTTMQIELPLSAEWLGEDYLEYTIKLPQPFTALSGQGKIEWKKHDKKNNHTKYRLALGILSYQQTGDLISILNQDEGI